MFRSETRYPRPGQKDLDAFPNCFRGQKVSAGPRFLGRRALRETCLDLRCLESRLGQIQGSEGVNCVANWRCTSRSAGNGPREKLGIPKGFGEQNSAGGGRWVPLSVTGGHSDRFRWSGSRGHVRTFARSCGHAFRTKRRAREGWQGTIDTIQRHST